MVDNSVTQRVISLSNTLSVTVATSKTDFDDVAALRYRCYWRERAIHENAEARLTDQFDGHPDHPTFLIFDGSGLIASIRTSILKSPSSSSPSMISFPNEVAKLTIEGTAIDPNRFVIDKQASIRHPELHLFVLTIPFSVATKHRAVYALASVRQEHRAFYRRHFLAREIAPPRIYFGLSVELALMCANFQDDRLNVILRNPAFGQSYNYSSLLY